MPTAFSGNIPLSLLTQTLEHLEVALPDLDGRVRDGILVVIPAYNEGENVGAVVSRVPDRVCGLATTVLVVDDGSDDGTVAAAEAAGAVVARHLRNRGGGAALRTGYALAAEAGAALVVTLDADGQHLPEEMPHLVRPIVQGRADAVNGSRTLGSADPNTFSRELGLRVFNRVLTTVTRNEITDCSSGYRAIKTSALSKLDLRQEQFHASEFLIEAAKHGLRLEEVPITVAKRMHGETKKPATLGYGLGFTKAIVRTWLR
jgi:glycosyltransferase involved in cell wall biosynthesis